MIIFMKLTKSALNGVFKNPPEGRDQALITAVSKVNLVLRRAQSKDAAGNTNSQKAQQTIQCCETYTSVKSTF